MIGLQTVAGLRREGVKPTAVFVYLVDRLGPLDAERFALSSFGHVEVTIPRADSLAELDFRPLFGLTVHLANFCDDVKRHRHAARLIAAVNPAHLVMPVWEGECLAVHHRWAGDPARSETHRA